MLLGSLLLTLMARLHLRVFGFHGQMCEVMAEISWRVRDVKALVPFLVEAIAQCTRVTAGYFERFPKHPNW